MEIKDMLLTKEVVCLLEPHGVTMESMYAWIKLGFVQPSVTIGSGRGSRYLFDEANIASILIFKCLIDSGLDRTKAVKMAKQRNLDNEIVLSIGLFVSSKIDVSKVREFVKGCLNGFRTRT